MDQGPILGDVLPGQKPASLKAQLMDEVIEALRLVENTVGGGLIKAQMKRLQELVEMIGDEQKPLVSANKFEIFANQIAIQSMATWKHEEMVRRSMAQGLVGTQQMSRDELVMWYLEMILMQTVAHKVMTGQALTITGITGKDPELEATGSSQVQ